MHARCFALRSCSNSYHITMIHARSELHDVSFHPIYLLINVMNVVSNRRGWGLGVNLRANHRRVAPKHHLLLCSCVSCASHYYLTKKPCALVSLSLRWCTAQIWWRVCCAIRTRNTAACRRRHRHRRKALAAAAAAAAELVFSHKLHTQANTRACSNACMAHASLLQRI